MDNMWQLYEKSDYKKINAMLDNHFNELINTAKKQIKDGEESILAGRNVRKYMELYMDSIEGYGTTDTEPRETLLNLICKELELPLTKKTIDNL